MLVIFINVGSLIIGDITGLKTVVSVLVIFINVGSLSIGDITGLKTVVSVCVSHIYKCGQPQYRRYYRIEDSGVCLC